MPAAHLLGRIGMSPATNDIKRNADNRDGRQRDNDTLDEQHRKPESRIGWPDGEAMFDKLLRNIREGGNKRAQQHGQPVSPDEPMRRGRNHGGHGAEQEKVLECHAV